MNVVFLWFMFLVSKSVNNALFSIFWNFLLANICGDWHVVFVHLSTTPDAVFASVTDKTNSNISVSKQTEVKLKPRSKTKLSKVHSVKANSSQLTSSESGLA